VRHEEDAERLAGRKAATYASCRASTPSSSSRHSFSPPAGQAFAPPRKQCSVMAQLSGSTVAPSGRHSAGTAVEFGRRLRTKAASSSAGAFAAGAFAAFWTEELLDRCQ